MSDPDKTITKKLDSLNGMMSAILSQLKTLQEGSKANDLTPLNDKMAAIENNIGQIKEFIGSGSEANYDELLAVVNSLDDPLKTKLINVLPKKEFNPLGGRKRRRTRFRTMKRKRRTKK